MRGRFRWMIAAGLLIFALTLAGCAQASSDSSAAGDNAQASSSASTTASDGDSVSEEVAQAADELRIGSMKGPTSIGLASMMTQDEGVFTVAASADEIAPKLLQDELDIVLVPANLAATLYQKTDGAIRVLDVNTLGVLYAVTASGVDSVEGLRGRTVYMTGKGTVPEYTVRALLEASNVPIDEVDLQFRSEPAEVVALISQDPEAVGILPQPYATSATMKDSSLETTIDLTSAWEEATGGDRGSIVTGVTIAKASTVEVAPEVIDEFIRRHEASTMIAEDDPDAIAAEVVELGIIDSEAIAKTAIPLCNVVCLTDQEMQDALDGYLEVLYEQDPASIGGKLPESSFYYYAQGA